MSQDSSSDPGQPLDSEVRALYTGLALHPERDFGWGRGKGNSRALGYDPEWLDRLPDAVWQSSAAIGNPFSIGPLHPGETVVDLGCGAGADVCVAALLVGPRGRVIGIDITTAMVEKARTNAALCGLHNVEIIEADIAEVPCPDSCAEVVISNGAINLSSHKACVLKEALRLLKPGGRFYVADMVRENAAPSPNTGSPATSGSWANCVAGTMTAACFREMLSSSGFEDVAFLGVTGYRTSTETVGALFRAEKRAE